MLLMKEKQKNSDCADFAFGLVTSLLVRTPTRSLAFGDGNESLNHQAKPGFDDFIAPSQELHLAVKKEEIFL